MKRECQAGGIRCQLLLLHTFKSMMVHTLINGWYLFPVSLLFQTPIFSTRANSHGFGEVINGPLFGLVRCM